MFFYQPSQDSAAIGKRCIRVHKHSIFKNAAFEEIYDIYIYKLLIIYIYIYPIENDGW